MQTDFLYPLEIDVGPRDLAWRWALIVCTLSMTVPIWFLPDFLTVLISILSAILLRFIWDAQFIIRKSVSLIGNHPDEWYLQMRAGDRKYVKIKSVDTFGVFVILKIEHFSSSSYLIQTKSKIASDHLHKLNLLSMHMVVR